MSIPTKLQHIHVRRTIRTSLAETRTAPWDRTSELSRFMALNRLDRRFFACTPEPQRCACAQDRRRSRASQPRKPNRRHGRWPCRSNTKAGNHLWFPQRCVLFPIALRPRLGYSPFGSTQLIRLGVTEGPRSAFDLVSKVRSFSQPLHFLACKNINLRHARVDSERPDGPSILERKTSADLSDWHIDFALEPKFWRMLTRVWLH